MKGIVRAPNSTSATGSSNMPREHKETRQAASLQRFLPASNSAALAGNEHGLRRIDVVRRREACLIERKAGLSARIDEQQRLFERHIAERVDERHLDFASGDRDLQLVAAPIAELQKIFGADVRDQVSLRTTQGDHFAAQTLVVHGCRL